MVTGQDSFAVHELQRELSSIPGGLFPFPSKTGDNWSKIELCKNVVYLGAKSLLLATTLLLKSKLW